MEYYICGRCKKKRAKYIFLPCQVCLDDPEYQKEIDDFNKNWKIGKNLVGRFREPVAFGYDKATGRPLAIDKKGNKFDPSETRYDLKHDRFGWKATGKMKPKKTYHI